MSTFSYFEYYKTLDSFLDHERIMNDEVGILNKSTINKIKTLIDKGSYILYYCTTYLGISGHFHVIPICKCS